MMNEFPVIAGRLQELGYRPVTAEDYSVFAPYYDAMNEAWSSALSFPCIIAWSDAAPAFYKITGGMICCLQYDGTIQTVDSNTLHRALLERELQHLLERRASPQMDGLYLPARRFRGDYGKC